MIKGDKVIYWELLATAVLGIFLYTTFSSEYVLSDEALLALPDEVIAVEIGTVPDQIQWYDDGEPLVVPEGTPVIARAVLETDSGYTQVALTYPYKALDDIGERWADLMVIGTEEGLMAFRAAQSSKGDSILPPAEFRKEGTILMRSSFVMQLNDDVANYIDEGWIGFRFLTRVPDSMYGHNFKMFIPTDKIAAVGTDRSFRSSSDDVLPLLAITGVRADMIMPIDLPFEFAQLRSMSGMEAEIRDAQSGAAHYPLSVALIQYESSLNLFMRLQVDEQDNAEAYAMDILQKRASVLHASETTVYDQRGRRVVHLDPDPNPEQFVERSVASDRVILRLPCGLAESYREDGCDNKDLILSLANNTLSVSNNESLIHTMHERAILKHEGDVALFIDIDGLRRYMDAEVIKDAIMDGIGINVPITDMNRVTIEGKRVDGGLVLRGRTE